MGNLTATLPFREKSKLHSAKLEKSPRLQRLFYALYTRRTASTWELTVESKNCAVSTSIGELRNNLRRLREGTHKELNDYVDLIAPDHRQRYKNGMQITCKQEGTNYIYSLGEWGEE